MRYKVVRALHFDSNQHLSDERELLPMKRKSTSVEEIHLNPDHQSDVEEEDLGVAVRVEEGL